MIDDPSIDDALGAAVPELPDQRLRAILAVLGADLRMPAVEISRAVAGAVVRYNGATCHRAETKQAERALAHLDKIDIAARHLANLITARANRGLVASGLMSMAIADEQGEGTPLDAADRVAAAARKLCEDIGLARLMRNPAAAKKIARDAMFTELVACYEAATGRRATATYSSISGRSTGLFIEFVGLATAGLIADQFAPGAIRTKLYRLRDAQKGSRASPGVHSPTATNSDNLLASEEMPDAPDHRPVERDDRGRGRARSRKTDTRSDQGQPT